jgi:Tol biopolymer transport system component
MGKAGLYRKMVGGGDEQLVYGSGDGVSAYKWLKDGRSILFINGRGKTFYLMSLVGEGKPVTLLTSEFDKDMPRVSPDERWVAYNSLESGRWEVYLATFPAFSEKRQASAGGGCQPLWRSDGKELFYLSLDGKLMATDVTGGAALQTLLPHVLFQTPVSVSAIYSQYTATADGKRFLFGEPINKDSEQITVVLNWASGLKR